MQLTEGSQGSLPRAPLLLYVRRTCTGLWRTLYVPRTVAPQARTRGKLRADGGSTLVDVAGGHGLVGCLAAIFMAKQFERVIVRDMRRPAAFDEVLAAAVEAAPWVEGRIRYEEEKVGPTHSTFPLLPFTGMPCNRMCWLTPSQHPGIAVFSTQATTTTTLTIRRRR